MSRRHGSDQRRIESLVNNTKKSKARMGQILLLRRLRQDAASAAEMRRIDTARKTVHAGMAVFLRLIKAWSAGENEIRTRKQLRLPRQQFWRRMQKRRQLI